MPGEKNSSEKTRACQSMTALKAAISQPTRLSASTHACAGSRHCPQGRRSSSRHCAPRQHSCTTAALGRP
eukprot:3336235-Pyramimonas_sp.AAC.1